MGSVTPSSEWSGSIVRTMWRCFVTQTELADEAGMSTTYLRKFLREPNMKWISKEKIENGLRSCVEKRGIRFEDVFP